MKKQIILGVIICSLSSVCVMGAETAEGLQYQIVEEKVYVSGYTGDSTEISIPKEIENLPVVYVNVENAGLQSLDVSETAELETIICDYNDITELDVSTNTKLQKLACRRNRIQELDLSNNYELKEIYCIGNQLMSIDFQNNKNLTSIWLGANNISVVDVSEIPEIQYLQVDSWVAVNGFSGSGSLSIYG